MDVAAGLLPPMLLGLDWLDPEFLLDQFGGALIWLSLAIVFVECGLFFPFLPGDTLLFALGLFIAAGDVHVFGLGNHLVEVVAAMVLLSVSALAGNVVGYEIGRKLGPPIYERDGRLLKRRYVDKTRLFFDRHGNKALVIARFVPLVRTYITVVAGVTSMDRRRFVVWSAVGAVAWVASITLLGYFLGAAIPALGENIDYAVIAIVLFTVIPLVIEGVRHRGESLEDVLLAGGDDDTSDAGTPDRSS